MQDDGKKVTVFLVINMNGGVEVFVELGQQYHIGLQFSSFNLQKKSCILHEKKIYILFQLYTIYDLLFIHKKNERERENDT